MVAEDGCSVPHQPATARPRISMRDRVVVMAMLRFEQQLRLSPSIQQMYDEYEAPPTTIERDIQLCVLRAFGFVSGLDVNEASQAVLHRYRELYGKYKNDDEVCQQVMYMKYASLMQEGSLKAGDLAPTCHCYTANCEDVELPAALAPALNNHRLVVICAGSGS